jgi:hypothetical protein
MNGKARTFFAVARCLLTTPGRAFAHHSMSIYDRDRSITLRATVTYFEWASPHTLIHFDVQNDNGNIEQWTAESPAPFRLGRHGWTRDSLRPGDQVTIFGNRKKDGTAKMRVLKLVLSDGQELDGYR